MVTKMRTPAYYVLRPHNKKGISKFDTLPESR